MALSSIHSLQLGLVAPKSKPLLSQPLHLISAPISFHSSIRPLFITNRIPHRRLCAIEKSNDSSNPASEKVLLEEQSQTSTQSEEKEPDSSTQVASELKQMLKEKKEREQQGDNLWIGVAQEVREIEWPDLGKVLGLTGVVLAVIAGSTAALLSVNAILAELSDQVFAGYIINGIEGRSNLAIGGCIINETAKRIRRRQFLIKTGTRVQGICHWYGRFQSETGAKHLLVKMNEDDEDQHQHTGKKADPNCCW